MDSIFTYSSYREYIRDAIEEKRRKNPRFSFRCAAGRIGTGSGTLSRILNNKRHLGASLLPRLISFLGLKRREAEYFSLLVNFELLADETKKRQCYRDILRMRTGRTTTIPEENHQFFEQWYHVALFELLRIVKSTSDSTALGSMLMPPISGPKARKAIEVLTRIGYIRQTEDESSCTTEPFLTTGDTWESVAIHSFQVAMSHLATKALDTVPKEERDFSTLTMALSNEAFRKVREVVKNARDEIAAIERECRNPERVFQINLQCFPLTQDNPEKGTPHDDR
ncbi:MAG: TIGR02147 family protein [Chitinispirillaceae bacterium]|nr:TIGR02147 family protein [Chitinispirillaceae bacterium]